MRGEQEAQLETVAAKIRSRGMWLPTVGLFDAYNIGFVKLASSERIDTRIRHSGFP